MKTKYLFSSILFTLLLLFTSMAQAESMTFNYDDCDTLYKALSAVTSGLPISTVGTMAEDMNALLPHVKALDAARAEAQRAFAAIDPKDPLAGAKQVKVQDDYVKFTQNSVKVDITRISLNPDEWRAVQISPKDYSVLLRFLKAK